MYGYDITSVYGGHKQTFLVMADNISAALHKACIDLVQHANASNHTVALKSIISVRLILEGE